MTAKRPQRCRRQCEDFVDGSVRCKRPLDAMVIGDLIPDAEDTGIKASLGVKEASTVRRLVAQVRARGVGVVFITHNSHHALSVGDRIAVLIKGSMAAKFSRGREKTRLEVLNLMAGGEEMESLQSEFGAAQRRRFLIGL